MKRLFLLLFLLLGVGGLAPALAQGDPAAPLLTATPSQTPTPTATTGAPGGPAITAVQPNSLANTADAEIVITGSGFVDGAAVILGGAGGLQTTFVSANLLRAVVPAGVAPGTYGVTVVNPNAASAALAGALTITAPAGPTATPLPTNTPAPTPFVRPLLVVSSYGASAAEITPNTDLDFEMTLANAGAVRADNVVATFVSGDFVPRVTGGVRALGSLDPNQVNRFWQPLHASGGLPNGGVATLQVQVSYTDANGTAYSETFALTFPVRQVYSGAAPTATPTTTPSPTPTATTAPRLRPQLVVTGYDAGGQLQPGMQFSLALTVQNQGNAAAERITMIVGGGTAAGGAIGGTPAPGGVSGAGGEFSKFAPVGTSNVQTLGSLAVGQSLEAAMRFIVNAATDPGAYPVKVSFVYEDAQNGDFVDDQVITLLVVRRPAVQMTFYAPPPPFFAGEPGSLPLQVVNVGSKSAVLGNFSVTADGAGIENGSVFVGNLEPGGFYPLDALIFPGAEGPLPLLLAVSYTDDFGQAQAITQTVTIDVLPPMVFEEPEVLPEDAGQPAEPEPETTWQKFWRFLLGLLGLSSGRPQPAVDGGGMPLDGGMPPNGGAPPVEGEFVP